MSEKESPEERKLQEKESRRRESHRRRRVGEDGLRQAKLLTINARREPTVEEPLTIAESPSATSMIAMSSDEILEGSIQPGQPRLAITINST